MRLVIKIGTSSLAYFNGRLQLNKFEKFCKIIADIANSGHEVILVSSGAIGLGMGKVNLDSKPNDLASKQALAALGQVELMYFYDKHFKEYLLNVSQVLVTNHSFIDENKRNNIKNTLNCLLKFKSIPIINENDTISYEEIVIGDNDTLSANVGKLVEADKLIIISDIDGLYDANPNLVSSAKLIPLVTEINDEVYQLASGSDSKLGTGGMITKIKAAEIVNQAGIDMYIINGNNFNNLYDVIDDKSVGTRFLGDRK